MPKTSALPAGNALTGPELTIIVQDGETRRSTAAAAKTFALEDFSVNGLSFVAAANYAAMRALLDLEAGTDFNAYSANLAGLSALGSLGLIDRTGSGTYTTHTATTVGLALVGLTNPSAITFLRVNADNSVDALSASAFRTAIGAGTGGGDLLAANNLSDVANAGTARTNLGLGTSATVNTGTSGAAIPLLNGANTHSGLATFSAGADITPASTPSTTAVGYLGSPVRTTLDSGNVAPALADCGCTFYHTDGNARDFTIPANGSVAFPVGTVLAIENENGAAAVSIIITSDTLRWGSSTGTRTLAANGGCSIQKVASTVWRIRGEGIT